MREQWKTLCLAVGLLALAACNNSARAQTPLTPEALAKAKAEYAQGRKYQHGIDIVQNSAQAAHWYRQAADRGYAPAQNIMGILYELGDGVEQDNAQAVFWYQKAAAQGLPWAQNNLGEMYQFGLGIARDTQAAVHWYKESAAHGFVWGQQNLGYMYAEGLGVARNLIKAHMWYSLAAGATKPPFPKDKIAEALHQLHDQMTEADRQQSKTLATACKTQQYQAC